jgi:hypothetical protein
MLLALPPNQKGYRIGFFLSCGTEGFFSGIMAAAGRDSAAPECGLAASIM